MRDIIFNDPIKLNIPSERDTTSPQKSVPKAKEIFINNLETGLKISENVSTVKLKGKASQKSGLSDQFMLKLKRIDGTKITVRAKKTENLNEAIVFHNMKKSNDSLNQFIPGYTAVVDKDGNLINLEELLQEKSVEQLCKDEKYKNCYIIMNDLVADLDNKGATLDHSSGIKDFKFARESLQGQNFEASRHAGQIRNTIYEMIRRAYFSISGCSFIFQESTKGSGFFTLLINNFKRLMAVKKTKNELILQLDRLPTEQLKALEPVQNLLIG